MLLLEADGKRLLWEAGIPIPQSAVLRGTPGDPELPGSGPWIAKVHIPVGGRGKAGGVLRLASADALPAVMQQLKGLVIKGCEAREVLVESAVDGTEHYLAILVDASAGGIRLLYSPHGGIDIESAGVDGPSCYNRVLPLQTDALVAAADELAALAPASYRVALADVARRLVRLFLARGMMLAEINPLFARDDGSFVAGDAKIVLDMNAVPAHPELRDLILAHRDRYSDSCRKLEEDFDFVEIDPRGRVGLITTGAGLSMMLIDELVAQSISPYNFCDVRTGQMRGSPARLLRILDWIAAAADVRVVLVNVFAGITDLGEFAHLLVGALRARPEFRRPIVARLVGNGEAEAARIIAEQPDLRIILEPDLERAIATVRRMVELPGATTAGGADAA